MSRRNLRMTPAGRMISPQDDELEPNEAKALFDGAAYAEMPALLERAEHSIRVTFYLFGGPTAEAMIAVLASKHASGLKVRVLLDHAMGLGATLPDVFLECRRAYRRLRRLGIDVRRSDPRPLPAWPRKPLLHHHKYIVVDDREALIGGMNVGTLFRRYHDGMISLHGPAAGVLGRRFDADWQYASGAALPPARDDFGEWTAFAGPLPSALEPITQARIVGTVVGRRSTESALRQNLRRAEISVCVALCEMGQTSLLDELIACRRRGVDVRVLLCPLIVARFGPAGILNAGAVEVLLNAGIAVHLYQIGQDFLRLHLKMALFDGQSAVFGSTNWTRGGFQWVGETDIELHGGAVIGQLAAQFEHDWKRSRPASRPTWDVKHLHALYERLVQ